MSGLIILHDRTLILRRTTIYHNDFKLISQGLCQEVIQTSFDEAFARVGRNDGAHQRLCITFALGDRIIALCLGRYGRFDGLLNG